MRRGPLSLLAVATMLAGSTLTLAGAADAAVVETVVGGVTYRADDASPDAGATVTSVSTSAAKALTLPDAVTISGRSYPVTAVGPGAASDLDLTALALPAGLLSVGASAFAGNDLTTLATPDSLTSVGDLAFADNLLTSVDLSESLTTIDFGAFAGNALTRLVLPESTTSVGSGAFSFNQIGSVTIPAEVTAIGDAAFTDNPLTTVVLAGPAPTTFTPTGGDPVGSLGDGPGPTVYYASQYAAPGVAGGFTAPTWQGYSSAVADPTLTVAPAALPDGLQGAAYARMLTATGGTGPYTFAVDRATLPNGLTLSSAGVLSGTPVNAGSSDFTVRVVDATGTTSTPAAYATRTYSLVVAAAPVAPTTPPTTPPTPAPTTPPTAVPATVAITSVTSSTRRDGVTRVRVRVTNTSTGPTGTALGVQVRFKNKPAGVSFPDRGTRIGSLAPGASRSVVLQVRRAAARRSLVVAVRSANTAKTTQLLSLPRR